MTLRLDKCSPRVLDPHRIALPAVPSSSELAANLLPFAYECWQAHSLKVSQVQLVNSSKPSRWTFEFKITTERSEHDLIGKVYSEDRSDIFDAMEKIWRSGLHEKAESSIPEPLAYLPSLRILVQEKVEGRVAKQIFLTGTDGERAEAAERCALWLAHFQALAPQQGKVRTARNFLRQSARRLRRIAYAGVPFANKAEELFRRLVNSSPTLEKTTRCAGHGDYSYNQVLFSGTRTVTCDWDGYDSADPCRDAARFIVCLGRLAFEFGSIRELDSVSEMFLKAYLDRERGKVADRLAFYKAALYLQAAKRDVVSNVPSRLRRAETLLDQGIRALAG